MACALVCRLGELRVAIERAEQCARLVRFTRSCLSLTNQVRIVLSVILPREVAVMVSNWLGPLTWPSRFGWSQPSVRVLREYLKEITLEWMEACRLRDAL